MQITQLCLLYWYVTNKYQTYKSHKSYKSGNQLACRAESHSAVSLLNSHWNMGVQQEFASKTPFKWNSFSNMTPSTFINFTRNKITDKPSISFQMWQISFSGFPIYIRQVSLTVKMWKYENKKKILSHQWPAKIPPRVKPIYFPPQFLFFSQISFILL